MRHFFRTLVLDWFKTAKTKSTMDLRKSITNQTDFSILLANHLLLQSKESNDTNLVLSPLSIHVVLSLIAAGSKCKTLDQILSFLKSEKSEDLNSFSSQIIGLVLTDGSLSGAPRLSFVNGVWVEKSLSLKPSFKEIVNSVYKAEAKLVDFQTKALEVANEVNSWVENATSGLIKELLPTGSVDSSSRLIFANALYFKGAWIERFDVSKTKDFEFHLLNGTTVQVPFMTSRKKQFLSSFNGFKALKLPYKQGDDRRQFSMYIFLPDERDGLKDLVDKMGSDSGFLEHHLPDREVDVGEFKIPRFKISFGFEASRVLKDLGLLLPFSGEGDLTEIVDSPVSQNLFVSRVFHKSFIEVNEEGTEAAAASAVMIKLRGLPLPPMNFVADHSFMFLIREDMTGVVLFIGYVLNPLVAS